MAFDLEGARKAGYSDAEIADLLARRFNFDIKGARSAGYSDGEVIAQLVKRPAPAVIPGQEGEAQRRDELAAAPSPGMLDQILGAGEAVLSTASSIPAMVGAAGGFLGAMAGAAATGVDRANRGVPPIDPRQSSRMVEDEAAAAMQGMTYAPRTQTGQAIMGGIGDAMNSVGIPAIGAAQGLRAPAGAMRAGAQAARVPVAAVLDKAATAVPAAVRELPGRVVAAVRPGQAATPGTLGSVGAAGSDMATQRVMAANGLPVPLGDRMTKGMATRNPEQLTFERETAKMADAGVPLRENTARLNEGLLQNFEAMIDQTGAVTPSLIEAGRSVVDSALVPAAARAKNKYRVKYKEAEKAGEMEAPVSTAPLVQFLTDNTSMNAPELAGATLGLLQRELVRLGGAEVVNGQLVPRQLTLGQVELLRRQVGNAMDAAPDNGTNMGAGVQAKQLIDNVTEGLGGDLYKEARAARRRYAQLFEDNAIVADLLKKRRGTADRQVALEDVFRRSVLNGSRESLGMLRRTLQVAGGPEGAQAWRELQGATMKWIRDEATKSASPDSLGNTPVSANGLNNAIRTLDAGGKLEFMFGRQGAQQLRDLNSIAADVLTLPREAWVNTSNTAAVLAATVDAVLMGGGVPAPVMSMARLGAKQIKDVKLRRRIEDALNNPKKQAPSRTDNPARQAPGPNTIQ